MVGGSELRPVTVAGVDYLVSVTPWLPAGQVCGHAGLVFVGATGSDVDDMGAARIGIIRMQLEAGTST
jgi:hypothetical protein